MASALDFTSGGVLKMFVEEAAVSTDGEWGHRSHTATTL